VTNQNDEEPVFTDLTSDDDPRTWGDDRGSEDDDDRIWREVPPHHGLHRRLPDAESWISVAGTRLPAAEIHDSAKD